MIISRAFRPVIYTPSRTRNAKVTAAQTIKSTVNRETLNIVWPCSTFLPIILQKAETEVNWQFGCAAVWLLLGKRADTTGLRRAAVPPTSPIRSLGGGLAYCPAPRAL